MKYLTTLLFFLVVAAAAHAQKSSSVLKPLLDSYYDIKNALVNSDAATTSAKAAGFAKAINDINIKTLTDSERGAFISLQNKLSLDAGNIAATKDIAKQRDYFEDFSLDFYSLAKAVKLTDQPVYLQYCPMKKASWLSESKAIKNPYYGSAMLTCGNVKEIF